MHGAYVGNMQGILGYYPPPLPLPSPPLGMNTFWAEDPPLPNPSRYEHFLAEDPPLLTEGPKPWKHYLRIILRMRAIINKSQTF